MGEEGTGLRSVDGGFRWEPVHPATAKDLQGVGAVDEENAWMVGDDGVILRTRDGGRSWEEQPSGVVCDLLDVCCLDSSHAWAVGREGTVLHTFDEGYTWYDMGGDTRSDLLGVFAAQDSSVWAVGREGTILRTYDAGESWQRLEAGTVVDLWSVSGSQGVVWAVGDGGTVLRSLDGGDTWEERPVGKEVGLRGIFTLDGRTAWVSGEEGFWAFTGDGGDTWEEMPGETTGTLWGVAASGPRTAWAVGWKGTILHRRHEPRLDMLSPSPATAGGLLTLAGLSFGEGGGSWVSFGSIRATECPLWSDWMIKVVVPAEVRPGEEVTVTTASGSSRSRRLDVLPRLSGASPRYCLADGHLILAGSAFGEEKCDSYVTLGARRIEEYVYWSNRYIKFKVPQGISSRVEVKVTTPIGTSNSLWVEVGAAPPSLAELLQPRIDFLDPLKGPPGSEVAVHGSGFGPTRGSSRVCFGEAPVVDYLSWSNDRVVVKVPAGIKGTLEVTVATAVAVSNGATFEVTAQPEIRGLSPSSGPVGAVVEIRGENFGPREGPSNYVSFGEVRPQVYEYWSDERILVKVPPGVSGTVRVKVNTPVGSSRPVAFPVRARHLMAVSASGSAVYAVGEKGVILGSANGGSSWEEGDSGTGLDLYSVSSPTPSLAWAVGEGGVILKTTDGGRDWIRHPVGATGDLLDVCAVDTSTAFAVGEGGLVLRTVNGGEDWLRLNSGTGARLLAVCAYDALHAWAVGECGTIIRTEDGGASWRPQNSRLQVAIRDVFALDPLTAFAVGDGGVVLKTVNGGETWIHLTSGVSLDLRSVVACSAWRVWVAGDSGIVLGSADGGSSWETLPGAGGRLRDLCLVRDRLLGVGDEGIMWSRSL